MATMHEHLSKTGFAKEIPAAVTTIDRWIYQGKLKPDVQVAGRVYFHRKQVDEARRLKQPPFGRMQ